MIGLLAALLPLAGAVQVQTFSPPAACPTCVSDNYVGQSNGSLPIQPIVAGKAYDRFITIWLENTDYTSAAASATFQKLAAEGILLTSYHGVTHPSEPNYIAAVSGDFYGLADDQLWFLPTNVSTVVDLLETKNISWASYQENMPTDGWAVDYTQKNYLNSSASAPYSYYKRKHNPHIIHNSVASHADRALRVRNFNDFAVDVNATALPQHVFVTPNMVNDAHDTDVNFVSAWLEYWLVPLLSNPNFNSNRTLIQLTFDENESYGIQNQVYTVLLGGAVPANLKGTNDSTFYTHYSQLSSVENNWDLPSLGRQDANKTVASVWAFQANQTGYNNSVPTDAEIPLLNLTGIYPGSLNPGLWIPILGPDTTATGAGNGSVFYNASAVDLTLTTAPTPINQTALNISNEFLINPNYSYAGVSIVNASSPAATSAAAAASATTSKKSGATRAAVSGVAGVVVVALAVAAVL